MIPVVYAILSMRIYTIFSLNVYNIIKLDVIYFKYFKFMKTFHMTLSLFLSRFLYSDLYIIVCPFVPSLLANVLFVLLSLLYWPLYCLTFYDLWLPIFSLVSLHFSAYTNWVLFVGNNQHVGTHNQHSKDMLKKLIYYILFIVISLTSMKLLDLH